MSRELVIERSPFGLRAALLEDGRLIEVDLLDDAARDPRGDIVLGRVRAVDRDLGAAFVDCGLAADALLGARDARASRGRRARCADRADRCAKGRGSWSRCARGRPAARRRA